MGTYQVGRTTRNFKSSQAWIPTPNGVAYFRKQFPRRSAQTLSRSCPKDVEVALSMLHTSESAVAVGAWRRAWSPARSALLVAQRTFLPEAEAPWAETWRRRLGDVRIRALESYAKTCLELGGAELPAAQSVPPVILSRPPRSESQDICF